MSTTDFCALDFDVSHEQPSVDRLREEWGALSEDERDEIFHEFNISCFSSHREPCEYWYSLLMPMVTKGYIGD